MEELGDLGFTADADGIRAAARHAAASAEGAGELRLGAVATTISHALSGARSAVAARKLATAWDTAISSWATGVADHAQRLTDSAAEYETRDVQATRGFRTIGPNRA